MIKLYVKQVFARRLKSEPVEWARAENPGRSVALNYSGTCSQYISPFQATRLAPFSVRRREADLCHDEMIAFRSRLHAASKLAYVAKFLPTRAGMVRPVIIKMDKNLGEDIVRSNMRTLNLSRKEFEKYLAIVRGHKN